MTKEQQKRLDDKVAELNTALKGNDYAAINSARKVLSESVAEVNEEVKQVVYKKCMKEKNPLLAALTAGYVAVTKVQTKKDKTTGLESVALSSAIDIINLVEFEDDAMRQLSQNAQWRYWVESYTKMLSKRVIAKVGTIATMEDFNATFKQSKPSLACKVSEPKTDAEAVKVLQTIFDAIIFEPDASGKNIYAATPKDVAYLEFLMCKIGKGKYGISTPRANRVSALITVALSRIVNKAEYDAEFGKVK